MKKHFSEDGKTKLCARCQQMVPLAEFHQGGCRAGARFGSWCAACRKGYAAAYSASKQTPKRAPEPPAPKQRPPAGFKHCSGCGVDLPRANFAPKKGAKLTSQCRDCVSARSAIQRAEAPREVVVGARRIRKYGTDGADLLAKQEGVCAICQKPINLLDTAVVDHCHQTGEVRGILCSHCNRGLGSFRDNPALISRAVEYLIGLI